MTSTTTPNNPTWAVQPFQNYAAQVQGFLANNPAAPAIGPTANQTSAFSGGASLATPNAGIGQGQAATRSLLNYTPNQVTAQRLADTDLTKYLNPWDDAVVGAAGRDFQYANELGLNSLRASTPTGAYGGSRQGVAMGQLVGENTRNFANTVAGLRQAGFNNAQNMALTDIANLLTADTGNADRGVVGAGLRLGAADQLTRSGLSADENRRSNLGFLADLGGQERQLQMSNDPFFRQLLALGASQGMLSGIPLDAVSGRTMTGTENSTSTMRQGTSGLDWLSAIANLWGAANGGG